MREWEKNVRKVVPYVPGEQPKNRNIIKLNTNENPYPPSPKVEEALRKMNTDAIRRYPDPAAERLVNAIAAQHSVSPKQVFPGVGSDDVLAMAFLTFFNSEKPVLFPDITYSFYDVWADLFRIPYECMPLNESLEIVKEDYYRENGGVIFPNPNAPTGVLIPLSEVEDIISHNRGVIVMVDEAYIDFGGVSAVSLLDRYENLLIIRTFSKSRSMAGMRIGYAIGSEELIRCLNDVKYSFNSYTLNRPSLILGAACVADRKHFQETVQKIQDTREWTKRELRKLGFVFADSKANFIFASHPECQAKDLFEALRKEHIYVRYFAKPRIDQYLRITVGTQEEMEIFIEFLKKYFKR